MKVIFLTWQPTSYHSLQSSTWSWLLLPPHSSAPDTDAALCYHAAHPSHCICFCLYASASVCGVGTPSILSKAEGLVHQFTVTFTYIHDVAAIIKKTSYLLVKLLLSSLDVLHLHSFLTHDRTEGRLIIIIRSPRLGEKRANN